MQSDVEKYIGPRKKPDNLRVQKGRRSRDERTRVR
jgi:hypothetical protein